MIALAASRVSSRNDPAASPQADDAQYPVASYEAPEPADPRERARRREKNRRYNLPDGAANPARFAFSDDSSPVALELPETHAPAEPALPFGQSDAVMLGTVTEAQAFLSDDKTSVYSEFTIEVEEALKQPGSSNALSPGTSVKADRAGGRVRLPSGKVLLRGVLGKTMPRAGRRYLLFLACQPGGEDFLIITGYELRGGRVSPLDGNLKLGGGGKVRQLAAYDVYEGMDETKFLSEVRAALASAPQAAGGGFR